MGADHPASWRHPYENGHMFVTALGRTANGWLEWKTEDGQTLDAEKRRAMEEESPRSP